MRLFRPNGTVLVGTSAVEQQELNPKNTIYDAKRFIGKTFKEGDLQFEVCISNTSGNLENIAMQ